MHSFRHVYTSRTLVILWFVQFDWSVFRTTLIPCHPLLVSWSRAGPEADKPVWNPTLPALYRKQAHYTILFLSSSFFSFLFHTYVPAFFCQWRAPVRWIWQLSVKERVVFASLLSLIVIHSPIQQVNYHSVLIRMMMSTVTCPNLCIVASSCWHHWSFVLRLHHYWSFGGADCRIHTLHVMVRTSVTTEEWVDCT